MISAKGIFDAMMILAFGVIIFNIAPIDKKESLIVGVGTTVVMIILLVLAGEIK